jgi:hypothetical protein
VDRLPAVGLVNPDDDQPAGGGCPPDHLTRLSVGEVDLNTIWIGEDLVDLLR